MFQIEPGTNGNHAPIGQAQNGGSSANIQEIPVSMENVYPEGTEDQYVTSPSGETLGCISVWAFRTHHKFSTAV